MWFEFFSSFFCVFLDFNFFSNYDQTPLFNKYNTKNENRGVCLIQLLRPHVWHLHLIPRFLDSNPSSTLHSSFLLSQALGESRGGSSAWVPVTYLRDQNWVLSFWLQLDTAQNDAGSWDVNLMHGGCLPHLSLSSSLLLLSLSCSLSVSHSHYCISLFLSFSLSPSVFMCMCVTLSHMCATLSFKCAK